MLKPYIKLLKYLILSLLAFAILMLGVYSFFPNWLLSSLFNYLMVRDNLYSANIVTTPYILTEPNLAAPLPYEHTYDGLNFRTNWVEKEIKELSLTKAIIFENDTAIILTSKNHPDISLLLAALTPDEIQGFKDTYAYMMGITAADLKQKTTHKNAMFLFNLLVFKGMWLGNAQEVYAYESNGNQIYQFIPADRGSRNYYMINLFSQKGDFHEIAISGPDLDQSTIDTLVNSIKVN
jgi:hypothetical protein